MKNSKPVESERPSLAVVRKLLYAQADARDAVFLQQFFKTGPGQYGAGDVFLGIRVPAIRQVARQASGLARPDLIRLLRSKYHEERLLALLIMVRCFERGDAVVRRQIFNLYLQETRHVNNWDLVDLSAPHIVGGWLVNRPRRLLDDLARSSNLWERRIAVLATFTFLRQGQFADTLRLCERLLGDPHDLMHKACGWMLREIGKRQTSVLVEFLEAHAAKMPRTMLRYAIERFPERERRVWLKHKSRAG